MEYKIHEADVQYNPETREMSFIEEKFGRKVELNYKKSKRLSVNIKINGKTVYMLAKGKLYGREGFFPIYLDPSDNYPLSVFYTL